MGATRTRIFDSTQATQLWWFSVFTIFISLKRHWCDLESNGSTRFLALCLLIDSNKHENWTNRFLIWFYVSGGRTRFENNHLHRIVLRQLFTQSRCLSFMQATAKSKYDAQTVTQCWMSMCIESLVKWDILTFRLKTSGGKWRLVEKPIFIDGGFGAFDFSEIISPVERWMILINCWIMTV